MLIIRAKIKIVIRPRLSKKPIGSTIKKLIISVIIPRFSKPISLIFKDSVFPHPAQIEGVVITEF